eukprot:1722806-Prymnesium_polylepis.2
MQVMVDQSEVGRALVTRAHEHMVVEVLESLDTAHHAVWHVGCVARKGVQRWQWLQIDQVRTHLYDDAVLRAAFDFNGLQLSHESTHRIAGGLGVGSAQARRWQARRGLHWQARRALPLSAHRLPSEVQLEELLQPGECGIFGAGARHCACAVMVTTKRRRTHPQPGGPVGRSDLTLPRLRVLNAATYGGEPDQNVERLVQMRAESAEALHHQRVGNSSCLPDVEDRDAVHREAHTAPSQPVRRSRTVVTYSQRRRVTQMRAVLPVRAQSAQA